MSALKENASASTMTMPRRREIVHAMLLDASLFAPCGELITESLALRSCDFQPQAPSADCSLGRKQSRKEASLVRINLRAADSPRRMCYDFDEAFEIF